MKRFANLKTYMVVSVLAAAFSALVVYFGTEDVETTIIWALITFIVTIVVVATLDLSFKPDSQDPNRPKLR